jgi:phospholipid-binding lipoprotein MlaA
MRIGYNRRMFVSRPALPIIVLLVVLMGIVTSGCTTVGGTSQSKDTALGQDDETSDPYEPFNRAMFTFNEKFDQWLLKPVAKGYVWILPGVVRQGVGNFFSNLVQPRVALNDLLQGKVAQSGRDTGRFLVNTTVGLLGFVDVATAVGLEPTDEDWGQTFAVWGMGEGPYFVWPIIGPRSLLDTVGVGFNWLTNPITYVPDNTDRWILWGVDLVDIRARLLPADAVIDQAAGDDKYVFIREAYRQRRRNLIYDGNPPKPTFFDDEPDGSPAKPATSVQPANPIPPP